MNYSHETLRRHAAVLHFKARLLGQLNIPDLSQSQTIAALASIQAPTVPAISARTWSAWLSPSGVRPKASTIQRLDEIAASVRREGERWTYGFEVRDEGRDRFYSDLVNGGLMQTLRSPTQARSALGIILERAATYHPASSLHLHFDAMDLLVPMKGGHGLAALELQRIAAARVLELLYERWNPRDGLFLFGADRPTEAQARDADGRRVRDGSLIYSEGVLYRVLSQHSPAEWPVFGIPEDLSKEQILRALFVLTAEGFAGTACPLLATGVLDAGTAAIAHIVHALSSGSAVPRIGVTPERSLYFAMERVLFSDLPLDPVPWEVKMAAQHFSAVLGIEFRTKYFERVQSEYSRIASELGYSPSLVKELVSHRLNTRECGEVDG